MPTPISGLRIARSVVTPGGAEVVTRELDFQLSIQGGVEIFSVLGNVARLNLTEATDTAYNAATQTLHLETGSLETVAQAAAEDEDTVDSEIFYRQDVTTMIQEEAGTRGGSLSSVSVTPNGLVIFNPSIFSARNLTHRGEGHDAAFAAVTFVVTIYYRFVKFSLSELGLFLARRS